ncbi:hypothetical protein ACGFSB_28830 [Streptomyces sp. NPDC048441]|uniref:hypothetical protein n=1 Tax=Streptomyces sp. NPDC048441 TaxID=3365552 RepID=UPI003724B1B3
MIGQGGQNGQWVRTRTDADAKAFLQEKQAEQERSATTSVGAVVLAGLVLALFVGWALYAVLR